jgi:hypothetical protein
VARIKSPEIYRSAGRRCRAKLRQRIFDKLGHACVKCGFADERALCIDHVNGGGRQEKLAIRNQHKFLKKVIDDTSGAYQILCANCNMIKMVENREYRRVATVPGRE